MRKSAFLERQAESSLVRHLFKRFYNTGLRDLRKWAYNCIFIGWPYCLNELAILESSYLLNKVNINCQLLSIFHMPRILHILSLIFTIATKTRYNYVHFTDEEI